MTQRIRKGRDGRYHAYSGIDIGEIAFNVVGCWLGVMLVIAILGITFVAFAFVYCGITGCHR